MNRSDAYRRALRPSTFAAPLLALALALAGCTRPDDLADESDDARASQSSGIDADSRSFQLEVGGPPMGPMPLAFDMGDMEVDVNATGLLVEARWTCQSPTCTLDAILIDPEGVELVRAPGTGEVSFFVENLTAGTYRYGVESSTEPVVDVRGEIAASVFYGSASAEGYTAWNETASVVDLRT